MRLTPFKCARLMIARRENLDKISYKMKELRGRQRRDFFHGITSGMLLVANKVSLQISICSKELDKLNHKGS